ncbi:hypothetical protein ABV23_RS02365 [Escherichia coli]|nr:hypothetical protein [Escherichia coli]
MSKDDQLTSVTLQPESVTLNVGDNKIVYAVYTPNTYTPKKGKWIYDANIVSVTHEEDTFMQFIAVKPSETEITYIPLGAPEFACSTVVTIKGTDPTDDLVLDPENETVQVNTDFYINVKYNQADGIPTWKYDQSVVKYMPDSTPSKAHFKALKTTANSIPLVCECGNNTKMNLCTVVDTAATISLNPQHVTKQVGDDYYVDIFYSKKVQDPVVTWDGTDEFLELQPDSNPYRAHFKVVKYSEDLVSRRITTSMGKSATHTCVTRYSDLKNIFIDYPSKNLMVGDQFKLTALYYPDTANHDAKWSFDSGNFIIDSSRTTPNEAYFTALKATSGADFKSITLSSGTFKDECKCIINESSYSEEDNVPVLNQRASGDLDSVVVTPLTIASRVGQPKIISAVFEPRDYSDKSGTWMYDPQTLDVLSEQDNYIIIKPNHISNTFVEFVSNDKPSFSSNCSIVVSSDGFVISPTHQHVKLTEDFYIDVLFDESKGKPVWRYDTNYIKMLDDSTDTKPHFQAFNMTSEDELITKLVCSYDNMEQIFTCYIDKNTNPISCHPSKSLQFMSSDFWINVAYDKENTKSSLLDVDFITWDDDNEYVELQPDSTSFVAHFKVVKYKNGQITRTATSKSGHTATFAISLYSPYTYIDMTPQFETYSMNSIIVLSINYGGSPYTPEYKKFNDMLNYDSRFLQLEDDSTGDKLYFTPLSPTGNNFTTVIFSDDNTRLMSAKSCITIKK